MPCTIWGILSKLPRHAEQHPLFYKNKTYATRVHWYVRFSIPLRQPKSIHGKVGTIFATYLCKSETHQREDEPMKPSLFFTHALSIVSILYISIVLIPMQPSSAETVAQSDAQLSLPEGARARLGKGIISDIAYSKDGNHLIVLSSIGTWTYDARTGAALDLFNAYSLTGNISGLSPDGSMLAIGSRDHTAILWDLTTHQQKSHLIGHTDNIYSMAFSPGW